MASKEKDDQKLQESIMQLQILQQRLQMLTSQSQQVQVERLEIENALTELSSSDKSVFKVIGGLMIEKDASKVKKELKEKNDELSLRLKNIEKQESTTKKKLETLQKELTANLR